MCRPKVGGVMNSFSAASEKLALRAAVIKHLICVSFMFTAPIPKSVFFYYTTPVKRGFSGESTIYKPVPAGYNDCAIDGERT